MSIKTVLNDIHQKEAFSLLTLWVTMFVLTLFFSELSMRSLLAALCAWVGGILTAELTKVFSLVDNILNMRKKDGVNVCHGA